MLLKSVIVRLLLLITLVLIAAGCARYQRVGRAEVQKGTLEHGSRTRTYLYYVPNLPDPAKKVPLVLLLHGGMGTGERMISLTLGGWNKLADSEGLVVVYPDGIGKHWNDGRGVKDYDAMEEGIDDVGYLRALVKKLSAQLPVDPARVYAAGISNGSMMSGRLACEASDVFAAVAMVAAPMPVSLMGMCEPKRPVSVMLIGGTKDPLVPFDGGEISFRKKRPLGQVVSYRRSREYWVKRNGCSSKPVRTVIPDADIWDGATAVSDSYSGGRGGSEVVMVTVADGGHTWPGGKAYLPSKFIGHTCRDFDANAFIWSFFKSKTRGSGVTW